tara:strand:- start:581 stop:691 length:111 start_codon:yes stop_codon:yes gene_type:complete
VQQVQELVLQEQVLKVDNQFLVQLLQQVAVGVNLMV